MESNKANTPLGRKLRSAIKDKGYKNIDVCRGVGLSPSRMSNYLSGSREPDFETLSKLAKFLGMTLDEFSSHEIEESDAAASARDYAGYLAAIDKDVSINVVTNLGVRHFSMQSRLVSRLINEYAVSIEMQEKELV